MLKKLFVVANLTLGVLISQSQAQSVNETNSVRFENGISWDQLLKKAHNENKYIFIDCYATWCGPCKRMDQYIFLKDSVGDFINSNFVSLKIQMDSTKNDSENVKNWYVKANELKRQYQIDAIPTLLFFNSDGVLVEKFVGAIKSVNEFLTVAQESLDSVKQYYTLLRRFNKGMTNQEELRILLKKSLRVNDNVTALSVMDSIIQYFQYSIDKDDVRLLANAISTSNSNSFRYFVDNRSKINGIMGTGLVDQVASRVLFKEIYTKFKKGDSAINWSVIKANLNRLADFVTDEVILKLRVYFAENNKLWDEYGCYLVKYYTLYGHKQSKFSINNSLWSVFENCSDKSVLRKAAEISKTTFDWKGDGNEDPVMIDTYANLLYKAGYKKEAIYWEKISCDKAEEQKRYDIKKANLLVLEKMKNNSPTWQAK